MKKLRFWGLIVVDTLSTYGEAINWSIEELVDDVSMFDDDVGSSSSEFLISVRSVRRFWFRIRGKSLHCDRWCSDKPDESYLPKVDKLVGHVDMAGVVQPKERQTGKQIVNVCHKRTLLFILHRLFFSSQLNSGRKSHNFISYGGCTRNKKTCAKTNQEAIGANKNWRAKCAASAGYIQPPAGCNVGFLPTNESFWILG